ncbi:MAG: hypothetical protein KAQ62_23040, partial [Cyclobacteriaceae bacterium]|nr:hypothetical protein [Cyclobacteriaceae bacterium]
YKYEDQFKIIAEIAKKVAKEIEVNITPEEEQAIETDPTNDLTAYDYYLRGNDYYHRSYHEEDLRAAYKFYEDAINIDSNFVLGWAGLVSASIRIYFHRHDRSEEQLLRIKEYLDHALLLAPESKEVRLEKGTYYYYCKLDFQKALQIYMDIKTEYPNDDELNKMIGAVYRRMGEYEKSLHYFNLSISLNPLNWESRISAGRLLIILGRYNDAEEYYKETIDLAPTFYMLHGFLFKLYLRNGQIKKAREFLQNNPKITHYVRYNRARMEFIDGNYDKALKIIKSTSEEEFFRIKFRLFHLLMRNLPINELATKHFESGKVFYLNEIEEIHDDPMLYCSLSLAYAGLGMKSEALEAGKKALDILNYSHDAFRGYDY